MHARPDSSGVRLTRTRAYNKYSFGRKKMEERMEFY
jgi:hypothetical protein